MVRVQKEDLRLWTRGVQVAFIIQFGLLLSLVFSLDFLGILNILSTLMHFPINNPLDVFIGILFASLVLALVVSGYLVFARNRTLNLWSANKDFDFIYRKEKSRRFFVLTLISSLFALGVYFFARGLQSLYLAPVLSISLTTLVLIMAISQARGDIITSKSIGRLCLSNVLEAFNANGNVQRKQLAEGMRGLEKKLTEYGIELPYDEFLLAMNLCVLKRRNFEKYLRCFIIALENPREESISTALDNSRRLLSSIGYTKHLGIRTPYSFLQRLLGINWQAIKEIMYVGLLIIAIVFLLLYRVSFFRNSIFSVSYVTTSSF